MSKPYPETSVLSGTESEGRSELTRWSRPAFTLRRVSPLRDLSVWMPALDAQLRDAPPGVDLVEFTGTVGQGSTGGSHRMDGNFPDQALPGHDWSEELLTIAKRFEVECVGVVLRSSRSGLREVDLIELPDCVTSPPGTVVGSLVLQDAALPALYRRPPDPTVSTEPAPSADPAALSRLIAQKIADATPATREQLTAVEAQLGVPLPDEVKAIYLTAGHGEIIFGEDADFYGMELIPLDDTEFRNSPAELRCSIVRSCQSRCRSRRRTRRPR